MNESDRTPPELPIDEETLAAFLEGGLEPEERARVVEILANSDDAYETFLEASQILGELESEDAVRPFEAAPPRRPFFRRFTSLSAAALLVLVAAAVWVVVQGGPGGGAPTPALLVAMLEEDPTTRVGWDAPAWEVVRSPDAPLTAGERGFRIGYLTAQFEAARLGGGTETAARLAQELAALASGLTGGGPLAALYRDESLLLASGDEGDRFRHEVWEATLRAVPDGELRAGAWAGAARLALDSGELGWFSSRPARAGVRAIEAAELPPGAQGAWERLVAAQSAPSPDADELSQALEEVARALGG